MAADRSENMTYTFRASMLEIYNEQIYDLLTGADNSDDKLDVKMGPEGLYVAGLRPCIPRPLQHVLLGPVRDVSTTISSPLAL